MRHLLLHTKLKAGSLLATLIISLVILASCLAFLLAAYYTGSLIIKDEIDQRLSDDMASGIALIVSGQDGQALPDSLNGLLFDQPADTLKYKKEDWGCIPLANVSVKYKGRNRSSVFFYGITGFERSDAMLYVADNARPVSLTGDAYIEGKVYLPKSGLMSHFFQHQGFSGKILIKGDIDTSSSSLPALRPSIRKFIRQLGDMANDDASAALPDSMFQSFQQSSRVVRFAGAGKIDGSSLKGKMVIVSPDRLEITGSASLDDVILYAPYIHFKGGFSGALQAFARDSIIVDGACTINYPGALVCGAPVRDSSFSTGFIALKNGAEIRGIVMSLSGNDRNNLPTLQIDSGATVRGLVYSEGYTSLAGRVEGAVFTNFLLNNKKAAKEINVLEDGKILPGREYQLGAFYCIFENGYNPCILKWLN